MPKPEATPPGAPCWVDLATSDPDRSRAFYGGLFGWTSEDAGEEFGHYVNFSKNGERVAGCMQNNPEYGSPDGWGIYLSTDDAKRTIDEAQAAGCSVVVPAMDVGDLGVMAIITDVGGATIGMWQPREHTGFGLRDEDGTPGWFELHTRDYDAAVEFYRRVFRWETRTEGDTPQFRYTTLATADVQYAGIMDATAFLPDGVPAQWSVYFRVASTDAAIERAVGLGASVVLPAEDTPYGRLAQLADPTGATFKLVGQ